MSLRSSDFDVRPWKSLATSALVACSYFLSSTPAMAVDGPIPIIDFVRKAQFGDPTLSPDGKHLVVTQNFEKEGRDTSYMVVYDLTAMKIVATVGMPIFEVPVSYRWITNSRLVIAVGKEFGSLERPEITGELLSMNLDGGNQEYLYGYQMFSRSHRGTTMADDRGSGEVAFVPQALTGRFLLTENLWGAQERRSRLFDVDATTAARRLVTEIDRPNFDFYMQNDGKPRFAYGPDDAGFFSVFRFDDATSKWNELAGDERGSLQPVAMLPGDKEFMATLSLKGGPRKFVRQSLVQGERTVLAEDRVGSMDRIERGPRPGVPFAVASEVDIPKPTYLDDSFEATLHKSLSAQFTGSYVHFVSASEDGKLIFEVSDDRDPGAYYLFDRKTNKASLLFATRTWIDPDKMSERRPIKFKARDGREIHGYLTVPKGVTKPPMVLLPHGGPYGVTDDWFYDADAQFLASRGYAVLQVNFRGSGGRGSAFEVAGHRQWGGLIQNDLIDGVKWANASGLVDESRVCAFGASFGAYSAMMVTILAPEMFKCAVGYSGVYDLPQMYEEDSTKIRRQRYNYLVTVVGRDEAELIKFSPSRQADKIKVPVLLVHGSRDTVTPPLQAETMRDALIKAGRPPEWMYVEQEGHGFYAPRNRQAFYEKLEKFLAANLKK